ncbi:MAG TPA: hypothetical protein VGU68_18170 [Ktedonobacteraceae bacterium]|nr:hypothetical protein [Ktedonobacteraceae bacterium]
MQRDGRVYNKAITQNHEANIAPGKSLADEVWTAFIRDMTTTRDFT